MHNPQFYVSGKRPLSNPLLPLNRLAPEAVHNHTIDGTDISDDICPYMNIIGPYRWYDNIGSANDLV